MENTMLDLSKLGYREIAQAAELLKIYADHGNSDLGDDVQLGYNPDSDCLFLTDEDYNTLMLNEDNKLELWVNCSYCGKEGFKSALPVDDDGNCEDCKGK